MLTKHQAVLFKRRKEKKKKKKKKSEKVKKILNITCKIEKKDINYKKKTKIMSGKTKKKSVVLL